MPIKKSYMEKSNFVGWNGGCW